METKFSFIVRPAEMPDAREINILRRLPEVSENPLGLPSETIVQNEDFIAKQISSLDDHLFCADIDHGDQKRVIGLVGMHVRRLPRERHSAMLGLMVHSDFHKKGIGAKLMETVIDLADNWLLLRRVSLFVFPDNESAIRLYKKFGFVVEGTMKYAVVRRGNYADFYLMARYNVGGNH
jgi:L-phenylalanine/L-methionine N-acetyltransferase